MGFIKASRSAVCGGGGSLGCPGVQTDRIINPMDSATIVAIIGIAVAVIVAVGVTGWQIKSSRDQPRPQFVLGEPSDDGLKLPVSVSNTGGAADRCHALALAGKNVYEYRGAVATQVQSFGTSMTRLGDDSAHDETEAPFLVWVVAADSRGRWWDVREKRRIRRKPIDKWLLERSQAQKLPIAIEMG